MRDERQPCVYILASGHYGTLYIGVTSNLIARLWQHRNNALPGFTAKYHVHRLVHFELFGDMERAITREKLLEQQWNRELARRKLNAERNAAIMKGDMDIANALGGILGAIGGAFMGNPMMGYQLGSQAGNLLGVGAGGQKTDMGSYTSYNTK